MTDRKRRLTYGGATVYERKDGRWVAAIELGYVNGRRKRIYAYASKRREVEAKIPALRERARRELNLTKGIKTVDDLLAYWLETSVRRNRAPKTIESYEGVVTKHISPAIGKVHLGKLNRDHVQVMLNGVALKPHIGPRSVQNVRAVLRTAFNAAKQWGYVDANYAEFTSIAKVPRSERGALTIDQARRLFDQVKDDRLEALYVIAGMIGTRRGEVLGLRWSDIDWDRREIRIRQQVIVVKGKTLITDLKTPASRRELPIVDDIEAVLRRRQDREATERMIAGDRWQNHGLVFPTSIGTPYSPSNLHKPFRAHLDAAGLPECPFHSLRHAAASFLVALNIHPTIAKRILGHTDIKTTLEIYSHAQDADMRTAIESVQAVLRKVEIGDS